MSTLDKIRNAKRVQARTTATLATVPDPTARYLLLRAIHAAADVLPRLGLSVEEVEYLQPLTLDPALASKLTPDTDVAEVLLSSFFQARIIASAPVVLDGVEGRFTLEVKVGGQPSDLRLEGRLLQGANVIRQLADIAIPA